MANTPSDRHLPPLPHLFTSLRASADRLGRPQNVDIPASDLLNNLHAGRMLLSLEHNNKGKGKQTELDSDDSSEADSDDSSAWETDEDEAGEDDPLEEDSEDPAVFEQALLSWINGPARAHTVEKYNPNLDCIKTPVPGLKPDRELHDHQLRAVAVSYNAINSDLKGMIIADHPGLGKTLSALATIAVMRHAKVVEAYGPCIVVAPVSCCRQWKAEIQAFFQEDFLNTVLLTAGESIPPTQLCKVDVIVTSYSYVTSELTRAAKFEKLMSKYRKDPKTNVIPKRPTLTLLSDLFFETAGKMGEVLVLDEAHIVKNVRSRNYAAITVLRSMFHGCLMLTGTPLDNTWLDAFALLSFLESIPIKTIKQMRQAFVSPTATKRKRKIPEGKHFLRFCRCMDACTLRRPPHIYQGGLVYITEEVIIPFDLNDDEASQSNFSFKKYMELMDLEKKVKRRKRSRKGATKTVSKRSAAGRKTTKVEDSAGFGHLMKAQQYANHLRLTQIMSLDKQAVGQSILYDNPAGDIELNAEEETELKTWRTELEKDRNWKSSRITAIVEIVRMHHELYPDDAFIIMDESVYFLDIVHIAMKQQYTKLPCWVYDGRSHAIERDHILKQFYKASGARILLASRGTGGVGLNLQCANVLIQCGPWWKKSWEDQARGRIARHGQTRNVFVYKCQAERCGIERYKVDVRDQKHRLNSDVLGRIEHMDVPREVSTRKCH